MVKRSNAFSKSITNTKMAELTTLYEFEVVILHRTCIFKIISLQGYFCKYVLRYMKPCFTSFVSGEGEFWSFSRKSKLFLELYWSGNSRSINLRKPC